MNRPSVHHLALMGSVAGLVILLHACQSRPATDTSASPASSGGAAASAPAPAAVPAAPGAAPLAGAGASPTTAPVAAAPDAAQTSARTAAPIATAATPSPPSSAPSASQAAPRADEHEHKAPHGGTLVELGEEVAHLELVLDARSGRLTAYALDGEAEQAVRLTQPVIEVEVTLASRPQPIVLELKAVANALTGETMGDTSQFDLASDALRGLSRFSGRVTRVAVRGQEFTRVAFQFPQAHARR